ncbi:hypothetical protein VTK26DRAFT_7886 [Humicola hyalothermophila]
MCWAPHLLATRSGAMSINATRPQRNPPEPSNLVTAFQHGGLSQAVCFAYNSATTPAVRGLDGDISTPIPSPSLSYSLEDA